MHPPGDTTAFNKLVQRLVHLGDLRRGKALQHSCRGSIIILFSVSKLTSMHEDNKLTLACFSCGICRSLQGRIPGYNVVPTIVNHLIL